METGGRDKLQSFCFVLQLRKGGGRVLYSQNFVSKECSECSQRLYLLCLDFSCFWPIFMHMSSYHESSFVWHWTPPWHYLDYGQMMNTWSWLCHLQSSPRGRWIYDMFLRNWVIKDVLVAGSRLRTTIIWLHPGQKKVGSDPEQIRSAIRLR